MLPDKDFLTAILNMLKELKENTKRESKSGKWYYEQNENIYKERNYNKEPNKILELKNIINEWENS